MSEGVEGRVEVLEAWRIVAEGQISDLTLQVAALSEALAILGADLQSVQTAQEEGNEKITALKKHIKILKSKIKEY